MGGDYYDLDALLAENEGVPCRFNTAVYGLGRALDPSCDAGDLAEGASCTVPFWMAQTLSRRNMAQPTLPGVFRRRLRDDGFGMLQGDTGCHLFYEFARKLCTLPNLEERGLLEAFALRTFRDRFVALLSAHALRCDTQRAGDYRAGTLANEELALFHVAQLSSRSFERWIYAKAARIEPSRLVRKRRRAVGGQDATFGRSRTRPVVAT